MTDWQAMATIVQWHTIGSNNQHALRGIAYLRMLAGERSSKTPICGDRWGNEIIPDYPPVSDVECDRLKARIEELVRKAAARLE